MDFIKATIFFTFCVDNYNLEKKHIMPFTEAKHLIAPCGMNCGLCIGYLREKNKCEGCRLLSEYKPEYCKKCIIINCEQIANNTSGFCYECPKFPCKRLKQLDKRYRNKYHMSMLENLETIKSQGLEKFVIQNNKKLTCPDCGTTLSVHRKQCLQCGLIIFKS